jgi:hypothetical protein
MTQYCARNFGHIVLWYRSNIINIQSTSHPWIAIMICGQGASNESTQTQLGSELEVDVQGCSAACAIPCGNWKWVCGVYGI